MADIQHVAITDPNIHEPKGASSAGLGSVYVSNGAGTGTWKKIDSPTISGISGDGGSSNLILVTNGTNGFTLKTRAAYGGMVVTNNTNNFSLTAATDPTLATNSDYTLFSGTGAPLAASGIEFGDVAFSTDRITVGVAGIYRVNLWTTISGYPTNTAKVAMKYRLNGSVFGPRRVMSKSNSAGDAGNLSGFGLITLAANDYIQLMAASSATGSLVITDLNFTLELVRAT